MALLQETIIAERAGRDPILIGSGLKCGSVTVASRKGIGAPSRSSSPTEGRLMVCVSAPKCYQRIRWSETRSAVSTAKDCVRRWEPGRLPQLCRGCSAEERSCSSLQPLARRSERRPRRQARLCCLASTELFSRIHHQYAAVPPTCIV